MKDVFEWDDATEKIVEKAVENRELDNATENLKSQAKDSLDKEFHQFNFKEVLRDRDTVVKSVQQVLGPKLNSFEKWHNQIEDRNGGLDEGQMQSDFRANKQDNAVDWSDYEELWENYERLRSIHSLTTIWAFVAHANSSDVGRALDIRQMQADQNEAMKLVNENYDKFIDAADRIGRQVKDGMQDALKEVLQEREERIEELEKEKEELKEKVDEGVGVDEVKPLTGNQAELVDLVEENPGKSLDWYADQMDQETRIIKKWETDIQNKGYKFEVE